MNIFQKIFGSKTIATMVRTWQEGKPTYPSVSYEKMVREGYRKNELMFSCIEAKPNTASQVSLKVYSKSTNKEMTTHPLSQLIRSPNPGMSEYDFWRSVIIYQDLAGRACYEKERNRSGQTVRLWPLRPDWLHPIPSSTSFLSGYIYEVPTVGEKRLKVDDVLDFKIFDPLDQYNSFPPIAVAARVGSVDNSATDYIKLFFERGGSWAQPTSRNISSSRSCISPKHGKNVSTSSMAQRSASATTSGRSVIYVRIIATRPSRTCTSQVRSHILARACRLSYFQLGSRQRESSRKVVQ